MIQPYDLTFGRNSQQHKILAMLTEQNLSTQNIRVALTGRKSVSDLRLVMAELSRKGFIRSVGFDQWTITNDGVDANLVLGGKPIESVRCKQLDRVTGLFSRPIYDGKELKDSCNRPGAYDYRKHPSLTANERVWYGPGFKRLESPAHP